LLNFSFPDDFFATTMTCPRYTNAQRVASNAAGFKAV
jgi:hypothetical protein